MKIDNICVYNTYPAILGIRNATRTWDRSDTKQIPTKKFGGVMSYNHANVGPKDTGLILKLLKSSNESGRPNHRKFLRQILVSFNLTAPKSFWSVFDSYKIGVTTNDSNTMPLLRKVVSGEQNLEVKHFEYTNSIEREALKEVISELNSSKDINLVTTLLPQSFLLVKSWTGSYENLLNIYKDQHQNMFYQWQFVLDMIKKLPFMEDLILTDSTLKPT